MHVCLGEGSTHFFFTPSLTRNWIQLDLTIVVGWVTCNLFYFLPDARDGRHTLVTVFVKSVRNRLEFFSQLFLSAREGMNHKLNRSHLKLSAAEQPPRSERKTFLPL